MLDVGVRVGDAVPLRTFRCGFRRSTLHSHSDLIVAHVSEDGALLIGHLPSFPQMLWAEQGCTRKNDA